MDKNGELTPESPDAADVQPPEEKVASAPQPTIPGAIKIVEKELTAEPV